MTEIAPLHLLKLNLARLNLHQSSQENHLEALDQCTTSIDISVASFIPKILSYVWARRITVSFSILAPVRAGTLYNITGKGEACATAEKC